MSIYTVSRFQGRKHNKLGIAMLTPKQTAGIAWAEGEGKWLLKQSS